MKFLKESNKDDKLTKINILYRDAIDYGIDPESLDKILYSNGANPDAPTFDIGLNVDKAYEELSNFLKKKYQSEFDRDYDDNGIPYDSYNILGFNKLAYKLELERLNKEIANLKDKYNINENKKELSNMRFLKEDYYWDKLSKSISKVLKSRKHSLNKEEFNKLLDELVDSYASEGWSFSEDGPIDLEDVIAMINAADNGELRK